MADHVPNQTPSLSIQLEGTRPPLQPEAAPGSTLPTEASEPDAPPSAIDILNLHITNLSHLTIALTAFSTRAYDLKHYIGNYHTAVHRYKLGDEQHGFENMITQLKELENFLSAAKRSVFQQQDYFETGLYEFANRTNQLNARHVIQKAVAAIGAYEIAKNERNQAQLESLENVYKELSGFSKLAKGVVKTAVGSATKNGTAIDNGINDLFNTPSPVSIAFSLRQAQLARELAEQTYQNELTQLASDATEAQQEVQSAAITELQNIYQRRIWLSGSIKAIKKIKLILTEMAAVLERRIVCLKELRNSGGDPHNQLQVRIDDIDSVYRRLNTQRDAYQQYITQAETILNATQTEHNEKISAIGEKLCNQTSESDAVLEGLQYFIERKRGDISKSWTRNSGYNVALKHSFDYGNARLKPGKALTQIHVVYSIKRNEEYRNLDWNPFNYFGNQPNSVMGHFNKIERSLYTKMNMLERTSTQQKKAAYFVATSMENVIATTYKNRKKRRALEKAMKNNFSLVKDFLQDWVKLSLLSFNSAFDNDNANYINPTLVSTALNKLDQVPNDALKEFITSCGNAARNKSETPDLTNMINRLTAQVGTPQVAHFPTIYTENARRTRRNSLPPETRLGNSYAAGMQNM